MFFCIKICIISPTFLSLHPHRNVSLVALHIKPGFAEAGLCSAELLRLEFGFMQAQQDQNSQGAGFTLPCIAFDKL